MKKCIFFIMFCLILFPMVSIAEADRVTDKRWTQQYDRYFKKYTKRYFGPVFDWRWFKAQSIAESGLKPDAKSHVGAQGIMQIMPATYREIKRAKPHLKSVNTPKWNIAAGIYYDRNLYTRWKKVKNGEARFAFMLASYNAGFGRVHKSYRKFMTSSKKQPNWKKLKGRLPKETRGYVARIQELMGR